MLKDKPGDVMARITHARLLAIKGNSAEAITTLREVVHDAPDNAQAHFILGQVLRQTGDLPGAKSELQEAASSRPHLSACRTTRWSSRPWPKLIVTRTTTIQPENTRRVCKS